ncbi:MAG: ABC transporter ATP-binding protein [Gammaproteobacteria bacterium]|nr:ABC transporter ATP-binding protein [Gammaproteobacteria bacterium]
MRLLIAFMRAYPLQTIIVLPALLLASLAEGLSAALVLPILNLASAEVSAAGSDMGAAGDAFAAQLTGLLDRVGLEANLQTMLVLVVLGILAKSLLVLIANQRIGYVAARLITDLRLELLQAVLASQWRYFVAQPIGSLANAMGTEAMRAATGYIYGMTTLSLLLMASVYIGAALLVSWTATLYAVAGSLLIAFAMHGLVRMARRAGKSQTKLYTTLMSRLTDTLQAVKLFKVSAREDLAGSVLIASTEGLNRALRREVWSNAALTAAQEPLYMLVIALGLFAAFSYFGMSIAAVTTLTIMLLRVMVSLGKAQKQYQKMMACDSAYWSLKRSIDAAREQAEVSAGSKAPTLRKGVTVNAIDLSFEGSMVLADASMEIPVGVITTLAGASGSGKSSIVNCVCGLLTPDAGEVLIDGVPLDELDLSAWRSQIGYVPQEHLILNDSIRNNVTLGEEGVSADRIEAALAAAGLMDVVRDMPQGLDAPVGERGARLSGGQRQRLMIARALLHRPWLLILDEATSGLDTSSERDIGRTLEALKKDMAILAVFHQGELARVADRTYLIEDARLKRVDG